MSYSWEKLVVQSWTQQFGQKVYIYIYIYPVFTSALNVDLSLWGLENAKKDSNKKWEFTMNHLLSQEKCFTREKKVSKVVVGCVKTLGWCCFSVIPSVKQIQQDSRETRRYDLYCQPPASLLQHVSFLHVSPFWSLCSSVCLSLSLCLFLCFLSIFISLSSPDTEVCPLISCLM